MSPFTLIFLGADQCVKGCVQKLFLLIIFHNYYLSFEAVNLYTTQTSNCLDRLLEKGDPQG